jgi:hypothetical protein
MTTHTPTHTDRDSYMQVTSQLCIFFQGLLCSDDSRSFIRGCSWIQSDHDASAPIQLYLQMRQPQTVIYTQSRRGFLFVPSRHTGVGCEPPTGAWLDIAGLPANNTAWATGVFHGKTRKHLRWVHGASSSEIEALCSGVAMAMFCCVPPRSVLQSPCRRGELSHRCHPSCSSRVRMLTSTRVHEALSITNSILAEHAVSRSLAERA